MKSIKVSQIKTNGGTQSRASIHEETVSDYADALGDGAEFPPVVLFFDGADYWLADGFHRHAAYSRAGRGEIPADVHQGTCRDAILFSVGANSNHGLRRSVEDKRRAVSKMLRDAEWSKWSDREIARQCCVSHPFVAKMRSPVTGNVSSEVRTYTNKHGTETTMETAHIGGQSRTFEEGSPSEEPTKAALRREVIGSEPDRSQPTEELQSEEDVLRNENAELRERVAKQRSEIADMKAMIKELSSENAGATISKLQKQLQTAKYARDEALAAAKRMEYRLKKAERRVKELEDSGVVTL